MFSYFSETHLVKKLFSCGVRLDGKLQLCIHGGHTDIDLWKKQNIKTVIYFDYTIRHRYTYQDFPGR